MKEIYLIGSLRNELIPSIGVELRQAGYSVFDDWFAPGPEADEYWRKYAGIRGDSYKEALAGYAATHIFEFDLHHLNRCNIGVMIMPSGKSGHLELGYLAGQGKPTYILFDGEPERWDIMVKFANDIAFSMDELIKVMGNG